MVPACPVIFCRETEAPGPGLFGWWDVTGGLTELQAARDQVWGGLSRRGRHSGRFLKMENMGSDSDMQQTNILTQEPVSALPSPLRHTKQARAQASALAVFRPHPPRPLGTAPVVTTRCQGCY